MRSPLGSLVAALGVGLALGACTPVEEQLARSWEQAEQYEAADNPRAAQIELQNALRLDPESTETNFRLGALNEREKNYRDALVFYRETLRLEPEHTGAALGAAGILIQSTPDAASALVDEVLAREPSNWLAYIHRTGIALAQADSEAALASARKALELNPKHPMPHRNLAFVRKAIIRERQLLEQPVEDAHFEAAMEAYDRAIALGAESEIWQDRVNRALTLGAWPGHAEDARAAIREASEDALANARPEDQMVALAHALSIARLFGDRDLERWSLEHLVEVPGSGVAPWAELALLHEREQTGAGEAVLKRLIETDPGNGRAHVSYARFLAGRGRTDEALAQLSSAAELGVEPPVVLGALVDLALQFNRGQEALEAIARLEQDHPDHPRTALARAQRAMATRRFELAAETLRPLVERQETAEAQLLLANAELRLGNLAAAQSAVDRGIELEGPNLANLRTRLRVEQARAAWNEVLRTLSELRQRAGRLRLNEQVVFARALYETGRPDQGRRVLKRVLEKEAKPPVQAALTFAALERSRDRAGVRRALEEAERRQPAHLRVVMLLSEMDLEEGRPERALDRINRIAAKRRLPPALLFLRSRVFAAQGEIEDARQDGLRVLQAAPNTPEIVVWLVSLYEKGGELGGLIESFESAERAGALNPPSRMLLARLYLKQGNEERAIELLDAAVSEQKDLAGAKNDLAYLLARQEHELERALTLAGEARAALREDPAAADTLGYVYLRSGAPERAAEEFRAAIALAGRRDAVPPTFHYHLGLALRALGNDGEAAQAFEAALGAGVEFPESAQARRELEAARASSSRAGPS